MVVNISLNQLVKPVLNATKIYLSMQNSTNVKLVFFSQKLSDKSTIQGTKSTTYGFDMHGHDILATTLNHSDTHKVFHMHHHHCECIVLEEERQFDLTFDVDIRYLQGRFF